MDTVTWVHYLQSFSKNGSYVINLKNSKRYISFNYYWRNIDWYDWETPHKFKKIGVKEVKEEDFQYSQNAMTIFKKSIEPYGNYFAPDIDIKDIELLGNRNKI